MAVFRWSVWGDKRERAEILKLSVGSFRRAFRDARFVICTDEPVEIKAMLGTDIEVIPHEPSSLSFNIPSTATWKKWCPVPRVAPNETEFYVDADVILVGDPLEVRRFCMERQARSFLVMQEAMGSPYYVGRFGSRILRGMPPVNTGFLGQRAGTDLTEELSAELRWWLTHVPENRRQFHDDQGAVVAVLSRRYLVGQVELLPQDRYCVISRRSNAGIKSLKGVAAVHLTMGHSELNRFRTEIVSLLSQSS